MININKYLVILIIILLSISCTNYRQLPDSYFANHFENRKKIFKITLVDGEEIVMRDFHLSGDLLIIAPQSDFVGLSNSGYFCEETQDIRVPVYKIKKIEDTDRTIFADSCLGGTIILLLVILALLICIGTAVAGMDDT